VGGEEIKEGRELEILLPPNSGPYKNTRRQEKAMPRDASFEKAVEYCWILEKVSHAAQMA
jgi:hypothetical protein